MPVPVMSDALETRLKILIVSALKLEDMRPEDIPSDQPLFGAGLNLDSIDALELVLQLEKEFGIKIKSSEESRTALASVQHMSAYVRLHATKPLPA
jgi:acyl carrier protein